MNTPDRIKTVEPLENSVLRIEFRSGKVYAVSLTLPMTRIAGFAALHDAAMFDTAHVADDGWTVEWACGLSMASERLYQMANFFNGKTDGLTFAKDIGSAKIEAPIQYPWNLLMAAANYQSHAAEMNTAVNVDIETDFPFLFAKSPRSCIIGTGEPYFIPKGRDSIDWEGEIAVVIGKPAREVPLDAALDYVFGFTAIYDVSDRGRQKRDNPIFQGPDWFSGKSRDRGAPMGPYITPIEFLPNHANLRIVTKVNDRVVQDGNTKDLIYDSRHLLYHISNILTLYPGDVIATGTPDGVGAGRKPPEFLKPGDVVSIEIEGIGTLVTPIEASQPTS